MFLPRTQERFDFTLRKFALTVPFFAAPYPVEHYLLIAVHKSYIQMWNSNDSWQIDTVLYYKTVEPTAYWGFKEIVCNIDF